ncbi:hypothetical protein BOTBODRAFT_298529 [Botryobasidium botryosum FD-172 SS1]|uniref:Uncharacterized protein n=1 Tax=Botryobasidium botryosum (strain FD-172 SS1) TaxID=930990 RepID=A0A067M2D4_BOTB1|nr:hypothetical protein BOTBODRAFT_298529 [Botryobasidium botryosum FD-172 SS1]
MSPKARRDMHEFTQSASQQSAELYHETPSSPGVLAREKAGTLLASTRAGLRHSMATTTDPRLDIKATHPIHYIKEHGQRAASWVTDCQDVGDALVCMDYHHDAMVVCFYARPEIQPNAVPDATSVKVHAYVSRAVQQTGNPVVQRAVALMLQTFQHKMAIPHAARWSSRLSRGTHSQGVLGTVPHTTDREYFCILGQHPNHEYEDQ